MSVRHLIARLLCEKLGRHKWHTVGATPHRRHDGTTLIIEARLCDRCGRYERSSKLSDPRGMNGAS